MSQLKRKRGLSLRTKWTIIMSIFILVTFFLFAVLFYKNTSDLMIKEGRERMEATLNDLDDHLAKLNQPLTAKSVNELFSAVIPKDKKEDDEFLIANLAQREAYVYIYNQNQQLIFKNQRKHKIMSTQPIVQSPKLKDVHSTTGYVGGRPVISSETGETIGYVQVFYELTNLYEIRKEIFGHLFIFMIVWIVLVWIFEIIISRYFINPLKNLSETIEDIKENPLTNKRAKLPKANDEIKSLTMLFNRMLDQMQRYIEQQDQFVSDVSHELRTPVAIIEGHLNLLKRWGKDDPEVLDESIKASVQEIERMKSLIQEMLELSRIEQSEITHYHETSKAKEVVTQVVNNFKMLHSDFIFIFDDDLHEEIEVAIYRNHLEQLLIILLDNAVKYSKDNQKVINISLSSNVYNLEIGVQDFGEGISEEDLKKIFDRFYRVDKARSREKGGNGLGLAIAQKLIEIYKGDMNVESTLGQGTVFKVEIPIAKKE